MHTAYIEPKVITEMDFRNLGLKGDMQFRKSYRIVIRERQPILGYFLAPESTSTDAIFHKLSQKECFLYFLARAILQK